MILDLENSSPEPTTGMDVCILGAGASGIILALELTKKGKRVILLEGGGLHEEPTSQDIFRSEITGHSHNGIHIGRFRFLGGNTNKWGGQILELPAEDFTERPWIEKSGWPFSKDTLFTYYARALELEGLSNATLSDSDVWRELGLKDLDLGPDFIQYFSRWCPEPNFAKLYGPAMAKEDRLHVFLHANGCELLLAEDGETVCGVRARTLSGKEAVFTAREYVICLGAIESSRFLLQPHAGSRAPWLQNDLLGRHYQDHIDATCGDIVGIHPRLFHAYFDNVFSRGYKYQPRFRLTLPAQSRDGLLSVAGVLLFEGDTEETLNEIKRVIKLILKKEWHGLRGKDMSTLARHFPLLLRSAYAYKVRCRAYSPSTSRIRLGVSCEQEPAGESRISLSDERDALGLYRTRLDWRISEREVRTIRQFTLAVQASFAEKGLATVVPDEQLISDPAKFVAQMGDGNHHMGGVRMATSSDRGVVDLDLKLFGTTNAYVCSSAVFPTSSFSNPTHTLLALTLRLADHLTNR